MNTTPLLLSYTESELQKVERIRKALAEARAQEDCAPLPDGFTLTGSDRQSDVAMAHGQKELFK